MRGTSNPIPTSRGRWSPGVSHGSSARAHRSQTGPPQPATGRPARNRMVTRNAKDANSGWRPRCWPASPPGARSRRAAAAGVLGLVEPNRRNDRRGRGCRRRVCENGGTSDRFKPSRVSQSPASYSSQLAFGSDKPNTEASNSGWRPRRAAAARLVGQRVVSEALEGRDLVRRHVNVSGRSLDLLRDSLTG
jgi:hypothetical protein